MKIIQMLSFSCFISCSILFGKGIYYDELKDFQRCSVGKIIFDAEDNNGLADTQMDIESYRPYTTAEMANDFFDERKQNQNYLSLSFINRALLASRKLSFFEELLQSDFLSLNPLIISYDTLPRLSVYIKQMSKALRLTKTPIALLAQQEGFGIFSRKILFFKGTLIIGQDLLRDLSDEELESLIVRELLSIKHNHSNKRYVLNAAIMISLWECIENFMRHNENNIWLSAIVVPAFTKMLINPTFENQVDALSGCIGKGEGLIKFYKRLEKKKLHRDSYFETTYNAITESKSSLSLLSYTILLGSYYCTLLEHILVKCYNKIAYNSPQERINTIKRSERTR